MDAFYVIDPVLQEVRRFDSRGRFVDTFVKRGQGPGEMRLRPLSFGLAEGVIWFSEVPTGRLSFVRTDGSAPYFEDTNLTAERLNARATTVSPLPEGGGYRVEAWSINTLGRSLRPHHQVRYLVATPGGVARQVAGWQAPGRVLAFDDGGTQVRYPGPRDYPLVVPIRGGRYIYCDPIATNSDGKTSSALITVYDMQNRVVSRRTLVFPAVPLTGEARAAIKRELIRGASWDGARQLPQSVTAGVESLVQSIPDVLPPVQEITPGPNNSIWLKLASQDTIVQEWLVLDDRLTVVAISSVPQAITGLVGPHESSMWATMQGKDVEQYVPLLRRVE